MTEPSATIATSVYERLRQDIVTGELSPGDKLRIESVRERYSAGNSPVREALNRLSSEGLVDRHEQRGFFVTEISVEDLEELAKTRCWLECLALRESMDNHSQEWEESIVLAFHRLSQTPRSIDPNEYKPNPEWEEVHKSFHWALISNCGSRWLLGYCQSLADQARRYREVAVQQVYPRRVEIDEHREIMDAIIARDADKAISCLEAHYQTTAKIIIDSFKQAAAE